VVYSATTNDDGEWNLTYTSTRLGDFKVKVTYLGNDTHYGFNNSANFTVIEKPTPYVAKIDTKSTISAKDTIVGKSTTIKGIAKDVNGNVLANAELTLVVDGKTYTIKTNSHGEWRLDYTPTRTGKIQVQVTFQGSNAYNGFTTTGSFNVAKRNIIVKLKIKENKDGSIIIIAKAAYEDDGTSVANHLIEFILDGKVVGKGITNKKGIAKLKIPANKITKGKHTITATVKGDKNSNNGKTSIEYTKNKINNKTSKNSATTTAAMKNTGIPITTILTILTTIGLIAIRKKNKIKQYFI